MTEEQERLFLSIAKMGVSCGLYSIFEWYAHYEHTIDMFTKYSEIDKRLKEAKEAFVAFLQQCPGGPDDPIEHLDSDGFLDMIEAHYRFVRERMKK